MATLFDDAEIRIGDDPRRWLWLATLALLGVLAITAVLGFFAGVGWITGNTMLGLEVPDEVRGRTFAFVGSMIRLALARDTGLR